MNDCSLTTINPASERRIETHGPHFHLYKDIIGFHLYFARFLEICDHTQTQCRVSLVKVYLCIAQAGFRLIIVTIITSHQGVSEVSAALPVTAFWSGRMLKKIAS